MFTAALCAVLPGSAEPAVLSTELKAPTVKAFEAYMRTAETRLEKQASAEAEGFLWVDGSPDRKRLVQQGNAVAEPLVRKGDVEVADGLIHDWVGAVFIPGATLDQTLAMVQNYDNHKNIYKPEVVDSRLLTRRNGDYTIFLRLLKKQVLTIVLNTNHDVHYVRVSPTRCYARSYTTRIAEVEKAGEPGERELAPGKGHGFLWRLNSFWRFEERDGGVYVECEAISLSRDVPTGFGWLINPIVRSLPRDSLVNTLRSTREALLKPPATDPRASGNGR